MPPVARLKSAAPQAVIYNGYDEMFVGGMAMGADGAIGTTFNVMGRLFVRIFDALQAGDMAAALALQSRANAVIDVLVEVGVFPGTKAMLKILGLDCGPMSGFDNAGVDREFFAGTETKSNFICSLGYGDAAGLFPRSPRFSFDEMSKIV